MQIDLKSILADAWGYPENILKIDFENNKVLLDDSGWISIDTVTFSIDGFDDEVSRQVNEKMAVEKSKYIKRENQLDIRESTINGKLVSIVDLLEEEKRKFNSYVSDVLFNLNKVLHSMYMQDKTKDKNEKMKEVTPVYISYENKVFERDLMKAIEEVKEDENPITIEQLNNMIDKLTPRKTFILCNPANEEALKGILIKYPYYELKPTSWVERNKCVLVSGEKLLFPVIYPEPTLCSRVTRREEKASE